MADEYPLLNSQYESEAEVVAASIAALGDSFHYLRYLQETMLIAFNNGGKPIVVQNTENNPMIFALITTTRAFSVGKAAIDQLLRGQPQVGMAMSRFLSEINQSTQYLVRHPNLIDGYMSGAASLERVLKFAKEENVEKPAALSRLWGLQSQFSHAGQEFLGIGIKIDGLRMRSNLLIYDEDILDKVFYGILGGLFTQYMIFRMVLKGNSSIEEDLVFRDSFLFDPENVRKFLGMESLDDTILEELHDYFNEP